MPSSPRRIYVDANVFIAYLNNEAGRAEIIEALFAAAEAGEVLLLTSMISLTEVAYVSASTEPTDADADHRIDNLLRNRRIVTIVECTEEIALDARQYARPAPGRTHRLRAVRCHTPVLREGRHTLTICIRTIMTSIRSRKRWTSRSVNHHWATRAWTCRLRAPRFPH